MYSDNKQIRDVADVAAKIMYGQQPVTEKLHPNQQQLDVHEPEKDELTSDDFKNLRGKKGGVVKEDDTGYQDRFAVKNGKAVKHNPEKGEHDEPHHVWADSPEHAVRKHAAMNKPKTEEVAEGFKFNSHERGAAERLKDMRKNEKEAEKMDKLYSAMRKKREQDKLKKEEIESIDEVKMADLPFDRLYLCHYMLQPVARLTLDRSLHVDHHCSTSQLDYQYHHRLRYRLDQLSLTRI